MPNKPASPSLVSTGSDDDVSLRRSGAVARMLRMPVATLRVWERRYALTPPRWSAGGQRLYSADDVRRLALIKQLTELGHAIGSLAALDMTQLQAVAATHAGAMTTATRREPPPSSPTAPALWRLGVVGGTLGARLHRSSVRRRLGRTVQVVGPYETMAEAAQAISRADVDALLIHQPHLHAGWLAEQEAAAPGLMGVPMAVLYGFAADAVCESLAAVGITLLREPQPDVVLGHWLKQFGQETAIEGDPALSSASTARAPSPSSTPRWDDATLMAFASRSSTVACECPRHVAELLMQLAHFEGYSADCENRGPADAALHDYLRQAAADSRARFEEALERVAQHEGWPLPVPSRS